MVRKKVGKWQYWTLGISVMVLVFTLGFVLGLRYEKLDYVRLIDGDTFVVRSRRDGQEWRVRLWAVDAPDVKECYFQESGNILRSELENSTITYKRYGFDGYGRILAEVFVDGANVEDVLVATGAAKTYEAFDVHDELKPSLEQVQRIKKIELEAKEQKVGMWSEKCWPVI